MSRSRAMLDRAGRAALRGVGRVEPNPSVGCVIVARSGVMVTARHGVFGGAHAEAAALACARERGVDVRGAEVFVTLEPCAHHGKTPPCAGALIDAGVGRVVMARRDPNEEAAGGAAMLRGAGIEAVEDGSSRVALWAGEPFVHRVRTGRSWVVAKWAQTLDGKLATRSGDSRWVSNAWCRRDVHRVRGRVDAVVTGIGTVRADDPLLTSRGVDRRRVAARVVVDEGLEIGADSALVRSVSDGPVVVVASAAAVERRAAHAAALRSAGVDVVAGEGGSGGIDLAWLAGWMWRERGWAGVLLEAGATLIGSAVRAGVVCEARVYVAGKVVGDAAAPGVAWAGASDAMGGAREMELMHVRRFGGDVRLIYRVGGGEPSA